MPSQRINLRSLMKLTALVAIFLAALKSLQIGSERSTRGLSEAIERVGTANFFVAMAALPTVIGFCSGRPWLGLGFGVGWAAMVVAIATWF
jgi:hypothetical protein